MRKQLGKTISQSYLSQIESGGRPHLTHTTRTLLARFFRCLPGFSCERSEGYHTELMSDLRVRDATLDSWLLAGAEKFQSDPELSAALLAVAEAEDSRRPLLFVTGNPALSGTDGPSRRCVTPRAARERRLVIWCEFSRRGFILRL